MIYLLTIEHKLHDNGTQTFRVVADSEEAAREQFRSCNPCWDILEIEALDDDGQDDST